MNMADVTVKHLAQVVGVPIERLLNQLQEAGLSFTDESQTVNEDQKRILLSYLKGNMTRESGPAAERITLKRKSVTQVTVGHDVHSGKTVNVEVRKKRTYVKRSTLVDEQQEEETAPEVEDIALLSEEAVHEAENVIATSAEEVSEIENLVAETVMAETPIAATVDESIVVPEVSAIEETLVTPAEAAKEATAEVAKDKRPRENEVEDKSDKTTKRRPAVREEQEAKKPKSKYLLGGLDEEEDGSSPARRRHKGKKSRDNEKSDKYREAEESMTHAFAMPTTPVVREVPIPETITVAELAKRMSVKAAEVIKVMIGFGLWRLSIRLSIKIRLSSWLKKWDIYPIY